VRCDDNTLHPLLVNHLQLQAQAICFRNFRIGSGSYKRHSPEALKQLEDIANS